MTIASNREEHLNQLIAETRNGQISRRHFIKLMSWSGISAVAALNLLDSVTTAEAGDLSIKKINPGIDRVLQEVNTKVNEISKQAPLRNANEDEMNDQGEKNVILRLTYPVGKSAKVFQSGWVFGAECLIQPANATQGPQNVSANVEWTGTAIFSPPKGAQNRPIFNNTGSNTIVLAINYNGKKITKTNHIEVVSTQGYATVGSVAVCDADAHGCPACPHPVRGPIIAGSPMVLINGKPAARLGDPGQHVACCGPNTFTIAEGDPQVLIDGKPAAKSGCKTKHCGGTGRIL